MTAVERLAWRITEKAARWLSVLCAAAVLASPCHLAMGGEPAPPPQSRREFVQRLQKIKEGMSAEQVQEILGKPDDVVPGGDNYGEDISRSNVFWLYGTLRHQGFATLGGVLFDKHGRVLSHWGTAGANELVAHLGEAELRRLLCLLADAGTINGDRFYPGPTLAAVNALQPLGQKWGVAVIGEYLTLKSYHHDAVILVMLALFDPPPVGKGEDNIAAQIVNPGYFSPIRLGMPGPFQLPPPIKQRSDWPHYESLKIPRFPLATVDGVPLVVADVFTTLGQPADPRGYLDELNQHATWRKQPLRPTDDPMSVLPKLMALLPVRKLAEMHMDQGFKFMMMQQVLRLLNTVYRMPVTGGNWPEWAVPRDQAEAVFSDLAAKFRASKVHWDDQKGCYVNGDGTTLPTPPPYPRHVYEPSIPGVHAKIVVERRTSIRVDAVYDLSSNDGPIPKSSIRVVQLGKAEKTLLSDEFPSDPTDSRSMSGFSFDLKAGQKVQIEAVRGNDRLVSPVYEP